MWHVAPGHSTFVQLIDHYREENCTGSTKLKKCSGGAPNILLTSYFFNPKPNPYPLLDPGRVIPGNTGGPGPRRRAGSQNPNPLGFLRGGPGSSVIFVYRLILLFLIQRHMFLTSYFINLVDPVLKRNFTEWETSLGGPRQFFSFLFDFRYIRIWARIWIFDAWKL